MTAINLSELERDKFISIEKEQFIESVNHFAPTQKFTEVYNSIDWEIFGTTDFQLFIGDLVSDSPLLIDNKNLLVVGNIKTPWLSNIEEGGALIVIGNIECDYYNHCWERVGLISGNFVVNKLTVNAFQDSSLFVLGDLKTEFYYGDGIWITVAGNVEIEYGIGHCLGLNDTKKVFRPKNNKTKSLAYLNWTEKMEVYDCIELIRQEFPNMEYKTYKVELKSNRK